MPLLDILRPGLKVAVGPLGATTGVMLSAQALAGRRAGAYGTLYGYVPGHGGDYWWVVHEGAVAVNGSWPRECVAPYGTDELQLDPRGQGPWDLFLDDDREVTYVGSQPNYAPAVTFVCRTVEGAWELVRNLGLPRHMYLDHDLGMVGGRVSEAPELLKRLLAYEPEAGSDERPYSSLPPPSYTVHSDNGPGRDALHSLMTTWARLYAMQGQP